MVWPGRSTPPERLPSPRMLASDKVFSGLAMPMQLGRDVAGEVAPELHRHGKGAAAMDAAVVSRGLAVELVHLAGAILDVPARDRGRQHLDQNVAGTDVRHRVIAVDELVRPAEFE